MVKCPSCEGSGTSTGIACYRKDEDVFGTGYSKVVTMSCMLCGGAKEVSEERMSWVEAGEKMRQGRVDRRVSQHEEARQLGISTVLLSQMEFGKVQPLNL